MSDNATASNGGNGSGSESLWTARQTASYLNVSVCWVYRRTEAGEIPHAKLGGQLRYLPARVREYAERLISPSNVIQLQARRVADAGKAGR